MSNGDIFRLTLEGAYTAESIAVQHVLWFRQMSDTPVAHEDEQLMDDFGNHLLIGAAGNELLRCQSPGFQWLSLRCQKMLDPFQEPIAAAVPAVVVGLGGNPTLVASNARVPSVCALVCTLQSERAGRSGMGRIYLGGFAASSAEVGGNVSTLRDHGRWHGSTVSHIQGWLLSILGRYNGVTVLDGGGGLTAQWGVWSRKFGNQTPPHNPAGFSPMLGVTATEIVRLQRRREFGVGQ